MELVKRGNYSHVDGQAGIRTEIARYSGLNGHAAHQFADASATANYSRA